MKTLKAIKTNKYIKDTLISLLNEKDFEKITVLDLTTRARINRSTFYEYFNSIQDCLNQIAIDSLNDLIKYIDKVNNSSLNKSNVVESIINYIYDHKEMFKYIVKYTNEFDDDHFNIIDKVTKEMIEKSIIDEDKHVEFKINITVLGFKGLMRNWILKDCKEDFRYISNEVMVLLHTLFDI